MEEKTEGERMQEFLELTQRRFDAYFGDLGYCCFVFKKEDHKGQSVFITNSPNDVIKVLEPYANAREVAETKARLGELRKFRRIK